MSIPIPEAILLSSHSSNFSLNDNTSNYYFLHNGDNSGLLLFPQPLTSENYNTWSRSISMALSAKNKVQFIDGTLLHSSTLNGLEFRVWKRCNDIVSSCIVNTISMDIATSIIYINKFQEMYVVEYEGTILTEKWTKSLPAS
jgi:hypothetical protein